MRDAPYPGDYPQDYVWLTSLTGYELGREKFPGRAFEACPPESPQKRERVPQDMFDPIIKRFATVVPERRRCTTTPSWSRSRRSRDRVVATVRDTLTGATRDDRGRLSGRHRRRRLDRARDSSASRMSGHPALTYTTNVIFRCPDFASLHDKGQGYRFIFIGPEGTWLTIVAINGGDRFRMSIVGTPDKVDHTRGRHPRRAHCAPWARSSTTRSSRCMRWVRRELVADSYGTRPRLHRRRRRASDLADRRARHEHRHAGRGRSRLEARRGASRGWGGPNLLATYEIERKPVAVRNIKASTDNLERMLAPRTTHKPPPEVFQPGPKGDAARKDYGDWYTELMRHEWFMNGYHLGYRYDDSPIVVAGRHAGAAARRQDLHPDRAAGRARAACLARARGARRSISTAAASCCCGSAPTRRPATALSARRRERGVPLEVVALDAPEVLQGL